MVGEAVSGKKDHLKVVEAVNRTEKWLRTLYEERRTFAVC